MRYPTLHIRLLVIEPRPRSSGFDPLCIAVQRIDQHVELLQYDGGWHHKQCTCLSRQPIVTYIQGHHVCWNCRPSNWQIANHLGDTSSPHSVRDFDFHQKTVQRQSTCCNGRRSPGGPAQSSLPCRSWGGQACSSDHRLSRHPGHPCYRRTGQIIAGGNRLLSPVLLRRIWWRCLRL